MKPLFRRLLGGVAIAAALYSCASVGRIEGGPYDETPPRFISGTPTPGALHHNKNKLSIEFVEFINQTKDLLVVRNTKVTTSLRVLDIASINGNDHFNLIFELLKEPYFIVRLITRKDTSSVEIFQHLTTKLQVELAVKLVNALQNMVALQIQILFRTKSLFLHKIGRAHV